MGRISTAFAVSAFVLLLNACTDEDGEEDGPCHTDDLAGSWKGHGVYPGHSAGGDVDFTVTSTGGGYTIDGYLDWNWFGSSFTGSIAAGSCTFSAPIEGHVTGSISGTFSYDGDTSDNVCEGDFDLHYDTDHYHGTFDASR